LSSLFYTQASTNSILSTSYYNQTSTNSILSTSYYNQTSTNSLLSSKQGFISSNSNLTLSNITSTSSNIGNSNGRAAALMVKGSSATTYSALSINTNIPGCNKNITLMGGNYGHNAIAAGSVNGTTSIYNLGLIPLITTNTILNTVPADLAPSVIKAIVCQKATNATLGSTNYGLSTSSCSTAQPGLVVSDGDNSCISVDGMLALIVSNIQNIYTNLKAAGVSGFTTY
jgi:hypothetical protein